MNGYDGNYPQYQFYQGPRPGTQFDPKFGTDALLQILFQQQAKQQLLDAFTPGGSTGSGAPAAPQGGSTGVSFLEQLLAALPAQPAAPAAPVLPITPIAPVAAPVPAKNQKVHTFYGGGGEYEGPGYGGLGMAGYDR